MSEITQEQLDEKQAEIDKLNAKNKEVLDELKPLKRKLKEFDGISAEDVKAALQSAKDAETANLEKKGEYEKIIEQMKADHAKEIEKLTASNESESGFVKQLLTERGLSDSLVKANVRPEYLDAAKAMLKGKVAIQGEGDDRKAVVGDKDLGDFVTDWAASDEGKHFVSAPNNSGGGAAGGNGSGGAGTKKRSEMSRAEKLAAIKEKGSDGYLQTAY